MKYFENIQKHLRLVLHRRVLIFLLLGVVVMFLTFFTHNNAFEIAISGVASIFIGIGVNNFSSIETQQEDEQKLKKKIAHAVSILQLADKKLYNIHTRLPQHLHNVLKNELIELSEFMQISIELIKEEDSL